MRNHSKKKYYIIYKIVNIINGFEYIGQHCTNNINDGYMGSGRFLKHDQKIFGIKNFHKTILFIFDNFHDMDTKERELVNEKFLMRKDVYNINAGGAGNQPGHVIIRNVKLRKNRTWPNGKPLPEKLISEGWEFGVYMTPAKKKANKTLNATKAKHYMYNGQQFTLKQLLKIAEKHISKRCLSNRLEHLKWSVYDAITIPPFKLYLYHGKMLTLTELSKKLKISTNIIKQRLSSGWTADEIKAGKRKNIQKINRFYYDSNGNQYSLDMLSKISGYHKVSILHKIKYHNISVDDIISGKCRKNKEYKSEGKRGKIYT